MKRTGETGAGFTLLELAVVISISSILAAASVAAVSRISELKTQAAVNTVVAHLRYLQGLALGSNLRTWAVFDAAGGSYRGYVEDAGRPGAAHRLPAPDPLSRRPLEVDLGAGILAGVGIRAVDFGGGAEVCFDPFGAPQDASGAPLAREGTVALTDGTVVAVSPVTGFTSIR